MKQYYQNNRHADYPDSAGIIHAPSSPLKPLLQSIKKVAPSFLPILLTGSTGVGKENFAHFIHDNSKNPEAPFVDINCASIPTELFESELFGHVKGSFTGAHSDRQGYMELVGGGTLFLDEIGEMPYTILPKLLRVLETRSFRPVGAREPCYFNGRIISATNRDLASLSKKGRFREDLFFRLAVFSFKIPDLSEHLDDIPYLVDHFLKLHNSPLHFTAEAIDHLRSYGWPGNVRELKNLIDRLTILSEVDVIDSGILEIYLPKSLTASSVSLEPLVNAFLDLPGNDNKLRLFESMALTAAMIRCGNNKSQAAKLLGIDRKSVERRLAGLKQTGQDIESTIKKAESLMKAGKFNRAMDILEKLTSQPDVASSSDSWLVCKAWHFLGICYQRTSGWVDQTAVHCYHKAANIAGSIGDNETIRSTKFLLWGAYLMGLDLLKARTVANELMIITQQDGSKISRQEAYLAVVNTSLWLGDCHDVINMLDECDTLSDVDENQTASHKIDFYSLGVTFRGQAYFQLGQFQEARKSLAHLMKRSGDENLVTLDRCFVFQGISGLACLFEEWSILEEAAQKMVLFATEVNSLFYIGIGKFFLWPRLTGAGPG